MTGDIKVLAGISVEHTPVICLAGSGESWVRLPGGKLLLNFHPILSFPLDFC